MDALISVLAWPAAVVIIAVVAILVFRPQVAALIGRTKRVGKAGLETFDPQTPQLPGERQGVDEFLRSFDNPLLVDAEQRILTDLRERRIEVPADREKALVRSLAATNSVLHFERLHKAIWASQLTLLRVLNTRVDGLSPEEVRPIYDAAKAEYPELYENYMLEGWLGFLERFNLVRHQNMRVVITVAGREFLKFLIADGRYGPTHG